MADRSTSAALAPDSPRAKRSRRGLTPAVLALPLIALTGVLIVAWASGLGDACGGPLPGCGNLRNAGEAPVTVREVVGQSRTEVDVATGERVMLGGSSNEVRVDPGQCLVVEGGPFWDSRTVIDRTAATAEVVWHSVDDWGAWVYLREGECAAAR